MASSAPTLRGQPRRRWLALGAGVVLCLAATSWVTGVPFWTSEPVEVVGGGPPPSDVAPPATDATTTTPLVRADVPATDDLCGRLTPERVAGALGADVTLTGPCMLSTTSGGASVTLEIVEGAFEQAFVTEAERWPQVPEVVADPWSALFFIDADRSALLVDGGDRAMIVRLTDASRDRAGHLNALTALALAALG